MAHPWETPAWKALEAHAKAPRPHLRQLLNDEKRCASMVTEHSGIIFDYSRQLATGETMDLLMKLADAAQLKEKIQKMFSGVHINETENRSVLHVALRGKSPLSVDGVDVAKEVNAVLQKIKAFSEEIRSGKWVGVTGKPLTDVLAIGIGGSYLGPLFVHTALETYPPAQKAASGRRLHFLANVDPEDVSRALNGLNPETTLAIVVSKTFTTAETMLNARTVKEWFVAKLGGASIAKHMVACSTALKLVEEFGINPANAFGFWDWVGGRFSVTSAVGVVPLSLQYGFDMMETFLAGCRDIDEHLKTAPFQSNIPVLMGLLANWNATFLDLPANAILPYCQGMSKLAPHIQQVSMESNGKGVALDGTPLPFKSGEIIFGEPGTNGQHSFYQLIHQGREMSCDFIGFCVGQQEVYLAGAEVSNHDELMSNFFAQADALALGKTLEELQAEKVPANLQSHKLFKGNRPSLSLLLPKLGPFEIGQILALYEHRTAVQGFLWGLNSFDQWGVELGKVLAKQVRTEITACRRDGKPVDQVAAKFNPSTRNLMKSYLANISKCGYKVKYSEEFPAPFEHFSCSMEGEKYTASPGQSRIFK